jgi:gliding motility-associated-like protein
MRKVVFSLLLFFNFLLIGQDVFEFIPNGGQLHTNALFKTNVPSGAVFLEKDGIKYSFYDPSFFNTIHEGGNPGDKIHFHAFKIEFENALEPVVALKNINEGLINIFLGSDPKKWAEGLKGGGEVYYKGIYQKIDFRIYARGGSLKYDFIVHPGGNVDDIVLNFKGVDELFVSEGDLNMVTTLGTLIDSKPVSFQRNNQAISTRFIVEGNKVRFWVDKHNMQETLTIDPVLIFSTYSGSVANNFGYTATYDDKGYLYAGGSVFSQGYPTTNGAFDITFNSYATAAGVANFGGWYWGISDIGITKYNLNGTSRLYSTYLGGEHCEVPHSLVVNNRDELFILGSTSSSNYPTTATAFDKTFGGGTGANFARGIFINYTEGSDIVVSRLSKNGDALLSSTFVGGSLNDGLNLNVDLIANYADQMRGEIILDKNQNVIIGSSTASIDFPITLNAYQNSYGGGDQDGVVFKMNEDLSVMIWSSYFGGTEADGVYSVIKSNDDNLYFAGGTKSANISFPGTAYQGNNKGGIADGYYVKLQDDGSSLLKGSYLGSDQYDQIYFVREDANNQVYFFGQSDKYGSYWIDNAMYNSPNSGQFITKLTANQQSIDWSTSFGSGDNKINISPTAFMVDLCNKVYLSGWGSPDNGFDQIGGSEANGTLGMEVTPNAYKPTTDNSDFYLMVLEDDASAIFFASFFGGNDSHEHVDGGTSRFDSKGVMYQSVCAGCGGNDDFPIFPSNVVGPTNDAIFYDLNGNGYPYGCNNGVFKFDFGIPNIIADFNNPPVVCSPGTINFVDNSKTQNQTTWEWDFGDGSLSTDTNPSHTYLSAGIYNVKMIIKDPTACNLVDSISKTVTIMGGNIYNIGTDTVCVNSPIQIGLVPYADTNVTYSWIPISGLSNAAISNPIATVNSLTNYQLIIKNSTCADTLYQSVFPLSFPYEINDTISCKDSPEQLSVSGNGDYYRFLWSSNENFTDTINIDFTDSTLSIITPNSPTKYFVRAVDLNGCVIQDSIALGIIGFNGFILGQQICRGDTIEISDTTYSDFVMNYSWTPLDSVISQNGAVIEVAPYDTIEFFLIKDYGLACADTLLATVNVPFKSPLDIQDTLLCNNINGFTLIADSSSYYTSLLWSSNNQFSDTLSLSNQFLNVYSFGESTSYLRYIDLFGCEYVDSVSISNIEFEIETTTDSVICGTTIASAEIINYSASRFDSLIWGPSLLVIGDSSSLQIDFNADKDINDVWVFGVDTNGCFDSDTVIVLNLSIAGADLPDTSICSGDSIHIGIDFDNTLGISFEWFPDTAISDKNDPYPLIWIGDTMTYGLIINNGSCVDTFYQTVNVSEISIEAFGDTSICNYTGLLIVHDSTKLGLSHHWSSYNDFSDTLLLGLNKDNYEFSPSLGITELYVKVQDGIGCYASDSVIIELYEYRVDYVKEHNLCLNDTLQIIPTGYLTNDSVSFSWEPDNLLISNQTDTIAVTSPSAGEYQLYVTSKSSNDCLVMDTISISVAKFDTSFVNLIASSDTLINNEFSVLTALPSGMVYNWQPGTGIISTDSNSISVSISETTTYTVLISDSLNPGCSRTDSITVYFLDVICGAPYIYVPNAFTPNQDGENDVMYVRGRNITELYFAIYDRWGELVFETKKQSVGWDGNYKGMKVDPAVFDYYLKYKCDNNEEHFMKGNITVIR